MRRPECFHNGIILIVNCSFFVMANIRKIVEIHKKILYLRMNINKCAMKKIFGLDLGTTSVGWAVVHETDDFSEKSRIVSAGSRVYPLSVDETKEFSEGKSITTNATRRMKHSARLNNHRFKLRRNELLKILRESGIVNERTEFCEDGLGSTHSLLKLRAKAASEKVSLEDFGRILMMLNKKRGYKSNRKVKDEGEGESVGGLDVALMLKEREMTPGQYLVEFYKKGGRRSPQFYKSDLKRELEQIVENQRRFHEELPDDLLQKIEGKNEKQTWGVIASILGLKGAKRQSRRSSEAKLEESHWRAKALTECLDGEQLGVVISKINGSVSAASGLLSAMSDRSKELIMNNETIGEYKMRILGENPHYSFRNESFYRKDYEDEFDKIWDTQSKFHLILTPDLRDKIRDKVIFYQRPLKSQKSQVSVCELEGRTIEIERDGKKCKKIVGPKVCPKSSPIFQVFRMWQTINNLTIDGVPLSDNQKQVLAQHLEFCAVMKNKDVINLLCPRNKSSRLNYSELEGNRTMSSLLSAAENALANTGYSMEDVAGLPGAERARIVRRFLKESGIDSDILSFDPMLDDEEFENQASYRLWHLLYATEADNSRSGDENLRRLVLEKFGMTDDQAQCFTALAFPPDYGSLSAKAMKRIVPKMMEGMVYSEACTAAGYKHSARSRSKDELSSRNYCTKLELVEKNSLRNPVVEKILNQMIHVVNMLVSRYGAPDEIRVEMARELKKSAKEREKMKMGIDAGKKRNEAIVRLLGEAPFNISHPSRNDIIRYRLYDELKSNGYRTLYSDTYISPGELFSKKFNIEHILPKAVVFDDSMSNKTLEATDVNIAKGSMTAFDFVTSKYGEVGAERYKAKVMELEKIKAITPAKTKNLLRTRSEIPVDFLNRDLSTTQYIARKAVELLEMMVPRVVATTGAVTDRLRTDWQLVDVMKELNWDKYARVGSVETYEGRDGNVVKRIVGWTKRNDHRHHAMDAITIAFTRPEYIQYLNNVSAESHKGVSISAIKKKYLHRDNNGNLRFIPPMPLGEMRSEVKRVLAGALISVKAKNRAVTLSKNVTKRGNERVTVKRLNPRAQLHNETVYARTMRYETQEVKVDGKMDAKRIATVATKRSREALQRRLDEFSGNPKKAFTGKNSLEKTPLYTEGGCGEQVPARVKLVTLEPVYSVRKPVSPDLRLDKVMDKGIRDALERRLAEFGGNAKEAFSNLDAAPIYLNRERGITIKRVRMRGPVDVVALHDAHDHHGVTITDEEGTSRPADYVSTSGNHHAALFVTPDGSVEEVMVSYLEAAARATAVPPLPIIDRSFRSSDGWELLFTLKRDEFFVFPRYEDNPAGTGERIKTFDPKDLDLKNEANYEIISPNLFRVQKLTQRDYMFRHHLETNVEEPKELRDITWKRITNICLMKEAVKVRLDCTGRIVDVGEY